MSAPRSLLQAALNRLAARVGSGLADTAATLSLLAQDAPTRLQQELSLFWEEVEQEAARLERGSAPGADQSSGGGPEGGRGVWSGFDGRGPQAGPTAADPQAMIDALRAQVARLAERLEAGHGAAVPPQASPPQGSGPAR
ncbi:MAG: hypothetical protein ACO3B3_08945 [Cyanobium sp.]|jgi:hypothetical protein